MSQPTTCHKFVKTSYIAMGGNVTSSYGAPILTLREALNRLSSDSVIISNISRFFATPAFPAGSGPEFVNAVVAVRSKLEPQELLAHLHDVERQLGRERRARWSERTIDLDLIAVDDLVYPNLETFAIWRDLPLKEQRNVAPDGLILPHPRLQDRSFVLGPLCDVAPNWHHPVLDQTAAELFAARPAAERAELKPLPSPE